MVPVMIVKVLALRRSAVPFVPLPYLKIAFSPSLTAAGSISVSAHADATNPSRATAGGRIHQGCLAIVFAFVLRLSNSAISAHQQIEPPQCVCRAQFLGSLVPHARHCDIRIYG